MYLPAFSRKYGIAGCSECMRRPEMREVAGCGKPPGPDSLGRPLPPYQALGIEVNECPIGFVYGVPGGRRHVMTMAALEMYRDRVAGRHVSYNDAPAWYDEAMIVLDIAAKEAEWRERKEVERGQR